MNEIIVALAGNPNVGKSTVFNSLTGMHQHTGNWPGKTVSNARGTYEFNGAEFTLVDLPGTYSLYASSVEEEIARDYLCSGEPNLVVCVTDATCLKRNLNLVLQIREITDRVVVCVNLLDEAKKKKIRVDLEKLSEELGLPVVGTTARSSKGLGELMQAIDDMAKAHSGSIPTKEAPQAGSPYIAKPTGEAEAKPAEETDAGSAEHDETAPTNGLAPEPTGEADPNPVGEADPNPVGEADPNPVGEADPNPTGEADPEAASDATVRRVVERSNAIYAACVQEESLNPHSLDRRLDRVLTSRVFGFPLMILLLGLIFWITITGANYPSGLLSDFFNTLQAPMLSGLAALGAPQWLQEVLVLGVYKTLSWVVSVMLPPMAIFFPLFTLLEDSGYLPRVAFNMDRCFQKACAHGKQSLTMCMGFGCNACGVTGCRIIDSPRERLIAILTNNFVPCNGRFPTLIVIITMFFAGAAAGPLQGVLSAALLTALILLGIVMTLLVSGVLSMTLLKGIPSSFALELPPYRRPQFGQVIIRSVLDRTLFVLGRAVIIAAPAGLVIWYLANIYAGDRSLLAHCTDFLDPFAKQIGLDGVILMAFILGFPANEIVIPIIIMTYMATGSMLELESTAALHTLLVDNGWTATTALCTMLFSLLHFPCGTTCWTIHKETGSWKWTALAFALPTVTGLLICFAVAHILPLFL